MDNHDMLRALGHSHRHKILRTLKKGPMPYSNLLARVEPERKGRGRFNYHLKVLKSAGLIDTAGAQYRLTPGGAAAAQLLLQASKRVGLPPRKRTQVTVMASLIGVGGIGLLLLLSIVLSPVVLQVPRTPGGVAWSIPKFVSDRVYAAGNPQVAADSGGNAVAIWTQDEDTTPWDRNLWANRFVNGVGWGAPTLIEKDDSGFPRSPMLAIDPAGNGWAVWDSYWGIAEQDDDGNWVKPSAMVDGHNVWANRFVAEAGWGEATLIAKEALLGDIGLDASGALTIVWNEVSDSRLGYDIYADRLVPDIGSLGATRVVGEVHGPGVRLAVGAEGSAMTVWAASDAVYASRYVSSEGWGPAVLIGMRGTAGGSPPAIAMWRFDQAVSTSSREFVEGKAVAMWHSETGDTEGIYAAFFVPRSGWAEAVPIGLDGSIIDISPQVVIDGHGIAIAAWGQSRPNEFSGVDLMVNRGPLGVAWQGPIRVAEMDGGGDIALAVEPGGGAAISYGDGSGVFAIRHQQDWGQVGGWGAPTRIGDEACGWHSCSNPDVAVDPAGNVIAVWEDHTLSGGVLASRFGEPTPLDELVRAMRDQAEQNEKALAATSARMAMMTVISLSLLVALMSLVSVLYVVYWNPGRAFAAYREIPDDSREPPGPGE